MRVLVSNDDGVDAPGIKVLAQGLREAGHEVVTVAPETLSISAFCAAMMASCRVGAATPPMLSVSLEASMTTSVMAVSLKVMVTFTSPMPVAVPV